MSDRVWAGNRIIEHAGVHTGAQLSRRVRPVKISAYGNGINGPSTHVVVWVHETPHGDDGASAVISLTPEQATEFAHQLLDLAADVLMEEVDL